MRAGRGVLLGRYIRATELTRRDPVEFSEFLTRELPGLTRFAGVLTGDRQLAHDLLADSLAKAFVRWRRIGPLDFPAAYVRQILVRTYLSDRRRSARRKTDIVAQVGVDHVDTAVPVSVMVADRDLIRRLLGQLTPPQRAAVSMRYFLDLPDADIADALQCTPSTVRSHLRRALHTLRLSADVATTQES